MALICALSSLQKRKALHLREIIQCVCAADAAGPPAPFPIGYFQAVVGTGGVGVAADMDQLLRLKASQVGQ